MEELEFVQEIKQLFQASKLFECIKRSEGYEHQFKDYTNHQIVQMYRSLSYYETTQSIEGYNCMMNLIEESTAKKGDKIEQIDLIIRILLMWQLFDENPYKAEETNEDFKKAIDNYEVQKQEIELNQDGIYQFALGMYLFIDSYRDQKDIKCIELLIKSESLNQQYSQELFNLIGWMYEYKQKQNFSLKWFFKLYEQNQLFPGIANNIALTYKAMNKIDKAEEYLLIASKICPRNTVILNNLASLYEEKKEEDKTISYFKMSYEINPQSSSTCYYYGKYLYKSNKEEGLKLLNKGLEINPSECEIYIFLASQIEDEDEEEYDKYADYIQKCIDLKPNEGYNYYLMADYYLRQSQFEQAIDYYQQSQRYKLYSVIYVSSISKIAFCLYNLRREEESLIQYIKSIDYDFESEIDDEIDSIIYILDHSNQITDKRKIEILNSFQGAFISRLHKIINKLDNKQLKNYLEQKLCFYTQVVIISAYQKYIQPNLFFQNEISHWDLFIE